MAKQSSKPKLTPGYSAFRAELLHPALFRVLSGTQVKLLVYMLKHGDRMFPSEARIVKDTGLNKGTVSYTLRGFAHAGLLLKQRRSKGVGLQSSNEYRLGDLSDTRLIEHLVASFGHKGFTGTMKALVRGEAYDKTLLEQFRWTGSSCSQAPSETQQCSPEPSEPETETLSSPPCDIGDNGVGVRDWTCWLTESGFKPNSHDTIINLAREHGYSLDMIRTEFEDIEQDTNVLNKQGCLIIRLKAGMVTGGPQIPGYDPTNEQHQGLMANIERWFKYSAVKGRGKQNIIATYFQSMLEPWLFGQSDEFKRLRDHGLTYVNGGDYQVHPWVAMKALSHCYSDNMPSNVDENDGGVIYNVLIEKLGNYIPTVEDERIRVQQEAETKHQKALEAQDYEREMAFMAYLWQIGLIKDGNPVFDDQNRLYALKNKYMSLAKRFKPEMDSHQLEKAFSGFIKTPLELAECILALTEEYGLEVPADIMKRAEDNLLERYAGVLDPEIPLKPGESYRTYCHRLHFNKHFRPLKPGQEYIRYEDRDYSYIPRYELMDRHSELAV